jgi:uncharacterized protein YggE
LACGATGVQGVEFEASNTDAPRQAALADAASQAETDATALANAMGGTLGRLVELTTEFEPVYPRAFKARAPRNASAYMMVSETPITPTEITIQSAIVARWEFLPTP